MSEKKERRNPDILETIADLSNDEVFTPPKLANDVLDMLPKELWSDSSVTFLDPAVKTGIFPRAITERLIEGLADEIPDLQERVNHILTKQVFGLGITELTTLMSRRSVYCSTTANGEYSVCTEFTDVDGNIKFPDSQHDFNENGKCEVCGAGKANYDNIDGLDNYAYSFLHDDMKEVFGDMKFDVIIGNPPYQISTGGGISTNAIPLYHLFVEKAIELNPKYITMIIPSRWMKGGKGLIDFREKMMEDKRIKYINDYEVSTNLFPTLQIDGGVNYFLWDSLHNGKVEYNYTDNKGIHTMSKRLLKSNNYNKVFRDNRVLSIVSKVKSKITFDEIVGSSGGSFGFNTFLLSSPERYSGVSLSNYKKEGYSLVYGVVGKAGGAKRVSKYINNDSIPRGKESIDKYKLFFSKTFPAHLSIYPKLIKGKPGSISTATYMKIGDFETELEMNNCETYMETKFFRFLLQSNRSSFVATKGDFSLIPLQDFSKTWTDEELYKKYKLTEEEIAYIEDNISPMGDNIPDVEDLEVDIDDEVNLDDE